MNIKANNSLIANSCSLQQLTDEKVFAAFTQGNVAALGILYDRYGLMVYRLIYRMLKNAQEAEDLTQEIFLKLQIESKFDPQRASFYTYLMTISRTKAIDRLRSRRSKGRFWRITNLVLIFIIAGAIATVQLPNFIADASKVAGLERDLLILFGHLTLLAFDPQGKLARTKE